uniref:Catenin (cadherin-associated protein), delta 1 n=1 Tax=Anabas testudineus TaxID=64144 RepID=A0A7N6AVQ1_ANATE
MEQCASTASLLASVREQERQFEMLSRALEEERRSCAGTLPRPLPNMQVTRIEPPSTYHQFRMEPGQVVQETYTVEEQPQESLPVISVETTDDGTTRRTETTVKKVVKTTTTRTVIPSVSDTLSLDGGGSVTGMGAYTAPIDRVYRQGPGVGMPMDYPTHTVPRNYHYGPPGGYDDYRAGPPTETYASLSRGARMDDQVCTFEFFSTILRSYEGTLDGDMSGPGDMYYWGGGAPLAQGERGSMASLDTLRKGPGPGGWRQPELPEVIAMLNYRLDPVRSNAAAYLQHLTYKNDKVKSDVRRLKGIPALVSMLDILNKEVHYAACGALKNISYGKDQDNKIAIKNCDGVPALVRLLRKTHDQDLTDTITGTLWNLSSHDFVKMEIVDHALHALADEVMVPHSGWEQGSNGAGGGEENCKPRHLEWETALTNTAGCLRNVSSERSEARRKLRECTGLVDSLMYIVQSQIDCKDVDNKVKENSVCLLRNLSYQVHREIPGFERFVEAVPVSQAPASSSQKGSCFSSRKGKGRKDADASADTIDIPKRTTPAKGYELLFQPEVVRIYMSLLKESKNPTVLEASAGAIQNLCAGRWTYGRYIRALVRHEKGLPMMTELLAHGNDRVVRAMSGALRNLAIDPRNRDLLGKHAVPHLVANLPGGGQRQPARALSEETVVSILSTLHEVLGSSLDAAKTLRASQGIERLVLINKDGNRSEREVRGAGLVLQTVWGYKELRRTLEKDGWKKTDFVVNLNAPSNNPRANGGYEDSTLPLIEKGQESKVCSTAKLDAYSTLDERGRRNTLDNSLEPADKDAVQVNIGCTHTLPTHIPLHDRTQMMIL